MQFQVILLLVLGISRALSSPHPDFSVQPGDQAHDHHHEHHAHAHEHHAHEQAHEHGRDGDDHHHEHDHEEVSTLIIPMNVMCILGENSRFRTKVWIL